MQPAAPGAGATGAKRAAVIVHPGKLTDLAGFRRTVCDAMAARGWLEPIWRETTADEPGRELVADALRAGAGLVLASGGDGTVAACVAALAGTGIPLGVLPAGTGNLLARNLSLPLTLPDALEVALTGDDRRLDVGVANGRPFAVMAGIGFDAAMLDGASERLKRRAGWIAYVLSGLRQFGERPMRAVLRADSGPPRRAVVSGIVVGNVGSLQGNVRLLPRAEPDDGLLDVALLAARGPLGWLLLAAGLVTRTPTSRLRSLTCRELVVDLDRERPWEADGEVAGAARQLRISLRPGNLLVRVPAGAP